MVEFNSIMQVYSLINRHEGITLREIIIETGISRAQVYRILSLLFQLKKPIAKTKSGGRNFYYTQNIGDENDG